MKQLIAVFSLLVIFCLSSQAQCCSNASKAACCASKAATSKSIENAGVEVIYFHATRRCATCQAVESVTTETLKKVYGTKVPFQSINREEDSNNPLVGKYKISGQTLLIIKGDKVVNLTNDAFLYARTNPEKFQEKLKSAIDTM